MIEITNVVFVPCECVDCGGAHHEHGQRCREFADGSNGNCRKCENQLAAISDAIDQKSQDLANEIALRESLAQMKANVAAQRSEVSADWIGQSF